MHSLLGGADGAAAAELMRQVAPTWYAQVVPQSGVGPAAARTPEAWEAPPERRKRELDVFLHELSRRRPVVVFLDDVHWADPSSADLLAFLGARCADMRLLLVLAYRPSDLLLGRHPFAAVQPDLQGRGV